MKRETRFPTNHEYLASLLKQNGVTKKDVSKLLGKNEQYIAYLKTTGKGLTNDDIKTLQDLMDVDMKKLILHEDDKDVPATDTDMVLNNLITKIGELEARMARMEERIEKPVTVSIPMNAKEMAVLVMKELLEGGVCTKDDVLRAFNEHHIPIEHISFALKANDAISATSGVSSMARTYYLKDPNLVKGVK